MKIVNNQKGLAQIPLMIGLLLMALAIPLTTKLVQTNQENRSKATDEPATRVRSELSVLKSRAINDLNMNLDTFLEINKSDLFGYTGSRLISGVIKEINQDTVSIETLNDGIVTTNLIRGDDPNNATKVFIRNNYSNTDGRYVTLDSLTSEESGRLAIVIFNTSTNNLYKLEIFKKEWNPPPRR